MITNLQYLGIYVDAIDSAIEASERAVEKAGYDVNVVDDLNQYALEDLEEQCTFKDITNKIIGAYFRNADLMIQEKQPDWDVDYYINCHDSHFYINKEEI